MRRLIFIITFLYLGITQAILGQVLKAGESYTPQQILSRLSQEGVHSTRTLMSYISQKVGDTTFTTYQNIDIGLRTYVVHERPNDSLSHSASAGVYINEQSFSYFCNIGKSTRQDISNIIEIHEFSFLGSNYLLTINSLKSYLDDDSLCYCYNLFDLNGSEVKQIAFSSLFLGIETFGDFNSDGVLDFICIIPKNHPESRYVNPSTDYLLTAYSVRGGKAIQLMNKEKIGYYLQLEKNETSGRFQASEGNWFFNILDIGNNTGGWKPHLTFSSPEFKFLYTPEGERIEKKRWSIHIKDLNNLKAAQDYCLKLVNQNFKDIYIMIDQYNAVIKYQVLYGNFSSKIKSNKEFSRIREQGLAPKTIIDFKLDNR